jgi:DNA-binding CsgD family transcriptional regulator
MRPPSHSSSRRVREGDPLTDREVQILSLVAGGQITAAIALRLGISENTIKGHLTHVYKKTGSRNRVQATRYYLDHYTTTPASEPRPAAHKSLIQQQLREIQARLDQLTPAATEAQHLQHALDALQALKASDR